jgi:hypothetical protein
VLSLALAAALLLAVGLALGRAPLFRIAAAALVVVIWLPSAFVWLWLLALSDIEERLRAGGHELSAAAAAVLVLLPPVLPAFLALRWLRRHRLPTFLWAWAQRPPTLSLPGILLVQAGLLVLAVGGGNLAAAWRESRAAAAWRDAGQPLESVAARYPKTATNAAGLELERLAAEVGIAVSGGGESSGLRGQTFHARVKDAIGAYVTRETSRGEGRPEAPPLEVRAWLAMCDPGLRAIGRHLRESAPIVWETDPLAWQSLPRFGLIDLHAALLTAALAERHQDPAGSESLLESAWRLTASLRDHPNTAARLNALAQDRRTLGALRASGTGSSEWTARLRNLGSPESVLGAQSVIALSFLEDARGPRTTVRGAYLETNEAFTLLGEKGPGALGSLFLALSGGAVRSNSLMEAVDAERARAREAGYRWLQGAIEKPYLRLCAADYATVLASACARTLASIDRCAALAESDSSGPTDRLAPWNIVGDDAVFLDRLARRSAMLGIEAELTALVLEARSSPPGAEKGPPFESRVCAGRRWVVERRAAGGTAIHLDNNPFAEREATVAYRLEDR